MIGPDINPPQASIASGQLTRHDFLFTGTAEKYFGICVRTFLLAILTLGIYDAWGTVERRRYLLGHTRVADHGFDYHAKPTTILRGRLIVFGILVCFQILTAFSPLAGYILAAGVVLILPWIIIRSLVFNAVNTSYRNIRFNFEGTYAAAFTTYLLIPLISLVSLMLMRPIALRQAMHFTTNGYSLGVSRFSVEVPFREMLIPWLWCWGLFAAAGVAFFIALKGNLSMIGVGYILITAAALATLGYSAITRNLLVGAAHLEGGHRFVSTLKPSRLIIIRLTNLLATTLSLGLLIPWASVRLRRYYLENTALLANGALDDLIAHEAQAGGAAAAEYGLMEGISDGIPGGVL